MQILQGLLGLFVLTGLAWVFSENRRKLDWRILVFGLGFQLVLALLLLKLPFFKEFFLVLNQAVSALEQATRAGTSFVFGFLGGADLPFKESNPGSSFVLAFRALPIILVMSALSALLFYWRILPKIVQGFAWVLQKGLGVGGALGLGTAANIFIGMVEAPLLIRPYLMKMSRSELFAIMTVGMATIAGTMMVLYAGILSTIIPDPIGHILTASIISAPAALMIARVMVPQETKATPGTLSTSRSAASAMDAITRGTTDGLKLLANIIALLLVLVALVSLANQMLALLPEVANEPVSLQRFLGWIMAPVVWLMGIPWSEAPTAGALMGVKTVLNEFLAYLQMAGMPEDSLSPRSRLIMTYALCGFANFGSLGIIIGGLGSMVPQRRKEIVELGIKSILAGTLATCLTGTIAGLII